MSLSLSRDQVRRVDELALQKYGIAGIVLMENAGRNAAAIIHAKYGPPAPLPPYQGGIEGDQSVRNQSELRESSRAVIFCGTGNNGGDGCVIARHLHNLGWSVRLAVTGDESRMSPDMAANYRITKAMGLETFIMHDQGDRISACDSIREDEVVIDALLGTGFRGPLREDFRELIQGINHAKKRATVAIDVPSGLDCDTGKPCDAAIHADLTVTFVASKLGFANPPAVPFTGRVAVADIGAPRELITEAARV